MNEKEEALILVISGFVAICISMYTCFKVYYVMTNRKSRHYRDMLRPEPNPPVVDQNGYALVNVPPIRPHLFSRSYKFNCEDYEDKGNPTDENRYTESDDKEDTTINKTTTI